LNFKRTLNVNS